MVNNGNIIIASQKLLLNKHLWIYDAFKKNT